MIDQLSPEEIDEIVSRVERLNVDKDVRKSRLISELVLKILDSNGMKCCCITFADKTTLDFQVIALSKRSEDPIVPMSQAIEKTTSIIGVPFVVIEKDALRPSIKFREFVAFLV